MKSNTQLKPLAVGVYDLALKDFFGIRRFFADKDFMRQSARRFVESRYRGSKVPSAQQKQHVRQILNFANDFLRETEAFLVSENLWQTALGLNVEAVKAKIDVSKFTDTDNYTQFTFMFLDQLRTQKLLN